MVTQNADGGVHGEARIWNQSPCLNLRCSFASSAKAFRDTEASSCKSKRHTDYKRKHADTNEKVKPRQVACEDKSRLDPSNISGQRCSAQPLSQPNNLREVNLRTHFQSLSVGYNLAPMATTIALCSSYCFKDWRNLIFKVEAASSISNNTIRPERAISLTSDFA